MVQRGRWCAGFVPKRVPAKEECRRAATLARLTNKVENVMANGPIAGKGSSSMEFFDDLSVPVQFLIAFVVTLAVLGVGGYMMLRPRGRQPRLAVIDTASVDGSRRLVLVARDDVEHLLLIGGPTDVVIEPNIDSNGAAATALAPGGGAKASPPLEPGPPASEPVHVEPTPVREALPREAMVRPPPAPVERQRLESLATDAGAPPPPPGAGPAFRPLPVRASSELAAHSPPLPPLFEPVFQIPPAPEPKPMPAPPLPQRAAKDEESNLADLAQRLEVALRRPVKPVEPGP
jgi:flagellar protein FliO/FliZ